MKYTPRYIFTHGVCLYTMTDPELKELCRDCETSIPDLRERYEMAIKRELSGYVDYCDLEYSDQLSKVIRDLERARRDAGVELRRRQRTARIASLSAARIW